MELSYSTDPNWCARCKHLPCVCAARKKAANTPLATGNTVKMRLEKRRGKAQVILFELPMAPAQQKELLKAIQQGCGAGGCVKNQTIEIHGDHRDKIEQLLTARGFKVKHAGG